MRELLSVCFCVVFMLCASSAAADGVNSALEPDPYDLPPFLDNTSDTLNVLVQGTTQSHTICDATDVDWYHIVYNATAALTPFRLEISQSNLNGGTLVVELYEDGLDQPPFEEFLGGDDSVQWLSPDAGSNELWIAVRLEDATTATYFIKFLGSDTGANNGLASTLGDGKIRVSWIDDLQPGDQGYRVQRSDGQPNDFRVLKATENPILPSGAADNRVSLIDEENLVAGTLYFYQILRVNAANENVPHTAIFIGYTIPIETPPPSASFVNMSTTVDEDAGTIRVTVALTESVDETVSLDYLPGGTARLGVDYTATVDTLEIPAGELTADISLDIVNDNILEGLETIDLTLINPVNVSLGFPYSHTVYINGNDGYIPQILRPSATGDEWMLYR